MLSLFFSDLRHPVTAFESRSSSNFGYVTSAEIAEVGSLGNDDIPTLAALPDGIWERGRCVTQVQAARLPLSWLTGFKWSMGMRYARRIYCCDP